MCWSQISRVYILLTEKDKVKISIKNMVDFIGGEDIYKNIQVYVLVFHKYVRKK